LAGLCLHPRQNGLKDVAFEDVFPSRSATE
jgi:hypothetical protein